MSCCFFLLLVLPLYCFVFIMYFYRFAANKSCSNSHNCLKTQSGKEQQAHQNRNSSSIGRLLCPCMQSAAAAAKCWTLHTRTGSLEDRSRARILSYEQGPPPQQPPPSRCRRPAGPQPRRRGTIKRLWAAGRSAGRASFRSSSDFRGVSSAGKRGRRPGRLRRCPGVRRIVWR